MILWCAFAVGCIQAIEYLNHTMDSTRGWFPVLMATGPLIIGAQFGLWKTWSLAPSILGAWIVFVTLNTAARLAMVGAVLPGQVASWWMTLVGCSILLAGAILVQIGLKHGL